jgi:uncharacterized protein
MVKTIGEKIWGDIDDTVVHTALGELDRRLRMRLGSLYVRMILFGSRARGDHQPDSDADVAIVLREPIADRWPLQRAIAEDTFDILLDMGLYIEPWPIAEAALEQPQAFPDCELTKEILRHGIAV